MVSAMCTVCKEHRNRLVTSLWLLLLPLLLLPSAHCGAIRGSALTLTCHPRDRDPCANFPELCSAGNGLCVVKKPCEYECVCPPDGRVGRDCSSGNTQQAAVSGKGAAGGNDNASGDKQVGTLLDSLLVFPPDLFWDLNHVAEQEDMIKTVPAAIPTTPVTPEVQLNTTPLSFVPTTIIAAAKVKTETPSHEVPAASTPGPTSTPAPAANPESISTGPSSLVPLQQSADVRPATSTSKQAQLESVEPTMSPLSLTSPQQLSKVSDAQATFSPTTDVGSFASDLSPLGKEQTTDAVTESSQKRLHDSDPIPKALLPHGLLSGLSEAGESAARGSDAVVPPRRDAPVSTADFVLRDNLSGSFSRVGAAESGAFPRRSASEDIAQLLNRGSTNSVPRSSAFQNAFNSETQSSAVKPIGSPPAQLQTSQTLQHNPTEAKSRQTTASTLSSADAGAAKSNPLGPSTRGRDRFPTFFTGDFLNPAQDSSKDDRALNRMVQRVFHPVEAFQMFPKH